MAWTPLEREFNLVTHTIVELEKKIEKTPEDESLHLKYDWLLERREQLMLQLNIKQRPLQE